MFCPSSPGTWSDQKTVTNILRPSEFLNPTDEVQAATEDVLWWAPKGSDPGCSSVADISSLSASGKGPVAIDSSGCSFLYVLLQWFFPISHLTLPTLVLWPLFPHFWCMMDSALSLLGPTGVQWFLPVESRHHIYATNCYDTSAQMFVWQMNALFPTHQERMRGYGR